MNNNRSKKWIKFAHANTIVHQSRRLEGFLRAADLAAKENVSRQNVAGQLSSAPPHPVARQKHDYQRAKIFGLSNLNEPEQSVSTSQRPNTHRPLHRGKAHCRVSSICIREIGLNE